MALLLFATNFKMSTVIHTSKDYEQIFWQVKGWFYVPELSFGATKPHWLKKIKHASHENIYTSAEKEKKTRIENTFLSGNILPIVSPWVRLGKAETSRRNLKELIYFYVLYSFIYPTSSLAVGYIQEQMTKTREHLKKQQNDLFGIGTAGVHVTWWSTAVSLFTLSGEPLSRHGLQNSAK